MGMYTALDLDLNLSPETPRGVLAVLRHMLFDEDESEIHVEPEMDAPAWVAKFEAVGGRVMGRCYQYAVAPARCEDGEPDARMAIHRNAFPQILKESEDGDDDSIGWVYRVATPWPDHPLFMTRTTGGESSRWRRMFSWCVADPDYFRTDLIPEASMFEQTGGENPGVRLRVVSAFKNYAGETEKLIAWLRPWIVGGYARDLYEDIDRSDWRDLLAPSA